MVKRFTFGNPIETDVVPQKPEVSSGTLPLFIQEGNSFSLEMADDEIVWGLGEAVRGINKRGFVYESFCTDDCEHTEEKHSLYGAHNFLLLSGETRTFALFIDAAGKVTFDVGGTDYSILKITVENDGFDIYFIEPSCGAENPIAAVAKDFRRLVGRSYIPPKWAFGIGQSRWGYASEDDVKAVAAGYRENGLPLDMIYLDIDYMDSFKNFTVNKKAFPGFGQLVSDMKAKSIRLIPIIDAGVKLEEGYELCDEGRERGFFCKDERGEDFVVGVWPGKSLLPDFLRSDVRSWFGSKYKVLCDAGIEGFWNDMNEPALFYSQKNLDAVFDKIAAMKKLNIGLAENFALKDLVLGLAGNEDDFKSFYHHAGAKSVRNRDVHNLYGFNMTRAAAESLKEISPQKRVLLFSRASCIGSHRYGGIWMGDNKSHWSHLLMNLKMLSSLNLCGFLYTGADIGGFGADTTEDLLLRWYQLGVFMPLLRNHSAQGTRPQEPYQFKKRLADFRAILSLRYRLLPYIYSEFMKAALSDGLYARPLGFEWTGDEEARRCEDQLLIGDSMMIAPVYEQNATGRHVYLPEQMKLVKFKGGDVSQESILPAGYTYVHIALDELVIFIRKGKIVPLAKAGGDCLSLDKIDCKDLDLLHLGEKGSYYELYDDDGESRNIDLQSGLTRIEL